MTTASSINFKARKKAAWISFFTSFVVLGMKIYAFQQTQSTAILSDALESVANVLTAIIAVFVIAYSSQPADEEHPYGHGKAEFFSSAFEGGLIFFAALMIFVESIKALSGEGHIQAIETGLIYISLATAINLLVGFYLRRVGHREKSETLIASGAHLLSDVKTTVGVAVGLIIVKISGLQMIDGLIALGVGLHLMYEGFGIVTRSFAGLVDATDVKSIEILSKLIRELRVPGIIDIHHLKAIRSGSFHHIDAHLVVPEYWDVYKAHGITQNFEAAVVERYPYDGEFAFHLDPCKRSFCRHCDVSDCPIRAVAFEQLYSFSAINLIQGPHITNEPDGSLPKTT
jgi:cation diffusion facilitator family transporter